MVITENRVVMVATILSDGKVNVCATLRFASVVMVVMVVAGE